MRHVFKLAAATVFGVAALGNVDNVALRSSNS